MRRAAGFTLIECMVAALLLAVGLLALAGSSRAIQQLDLLGGRLAVAAQAAASRIAVLRAVPCAAPSSGAAAGPAVSERWTLTTAGALRSAVVQVSFVAADRSRTVQYEASWLCAP